MPSYQIRLRTIGDQSPRQERIALFPAINQVAPLPLSVPRVPVPDVVRPFAAPDHGPGICRLHQRKGPASLSGIELNPPSYRNPGTNTARRLAQAKPGNDHYRHKRDMVRHTRRRGCLPLL